MNEATKTKTEEKKEKARDTIRAMETLLAQNVDQLGHRRLDHVNSHRAGNKSPGGNQPTGLAQHHRNHAWLWLRARLKACREHFKTELVIDEFSFDLVVIAALAFAALCLIFAGLLLFT